MPGTYLTDLAWVLRSAGLTVIEEPGWQTRARRSGGFAAGRPTHIMEHHTASPPSSDGQRDVDYIVKGSPDAPICNVYFNRAGTVWVCAGGATNTNGKGADTWGGGVPNDKMNEHAIGFEIANTGVGEPYPQPQQDAVMVATVALCRHYRIPSEFVRAHFEWAPTRKIDPSGPSRWAPNGGKWNMSAFRTEVRLGIIGPPAPTPDPLPEDDDMTYLFKLTSGEYGLRGPSGSRRVSGEEFGHTVPPREQARQVAAGSNEEAWIRLELAAYDKALGV